MTMTRTPPVRPVRPEPVSGSPAGARHPAPVQPHPPEPVGHAPSSGSVKATDGSIITWSTAADGTITATGPAQTLVLSRSTTASGRLQVQSYADHGSTAPYLRLSTFVSSSLRSVTMTAKAGGSEVKIVFENIDAATRKAAGVVSGQVNGKPLGWHGTVDLPPAPDKAAPVPGWPVAVFAAQFARLAYFEPAMREFPAARVAAGTSDASTATGGRQPAEGGRFRAAAIDGRGGQKPSSNAEAVKTVLGATLSGLFALGVGAAGVALELEGLPVVILIAVLTIPFEIAREQLMKDPPPTDGSGNGDAGNVSTQGSGSASDDSGSASGDSGVDQSGGQNASSSQGSGETGTWGGNSTAGDSSSGQTNGNQSDAPTGDDQTSGTSGDDPATIGGTSSNPADAGDAGEGGTANGGGTSGVGSSAGSGDGPVSSSSGESSSGSASSGGGDAGGGGGGGDAGGGGDFGSGGDGGMKADLRLGRKRPPVAAS